MKTKLLKRLRKRFVIESRNGSYRVFDNLECLGNVYNKTSWISKHEAITIQRDWILIAAQQHKKPKYIIK